jgi:flagellar biogenesis protein FliO
MITFEYDPVFTSIIFLLLIVVILAFIIMRLKILEDSPGATQVREQGMR